MNSKFSLHALPSVGTLGVTSVGCLFIVIRSVGRHEVDVALFPTHAPSIVIMSARLLSDIYIWQVIA